MNPPKPTAPKAVSKKASKNQGRVHQGQGRVHGADQGLPDLHLHLHHPAARHEQGSELRKMVFWALTLGQTSKYLQAPSLLFAPIPKGVLVAAEKTLKQVQPGT